MAASILDHRHRSAMINEDSVSKHTIRPTTTNSIEIAFLCLVQRMVKEFRALAKVPVPGTLPLGAPLEFAEHDLEKSLHDCLGKWVHGSWQMRHDDAHCIVMLDTAKRNALSIRRQLEQLEAHLQDVAADRPADMDQCSVHPFLNSNLASSEINHLVCQAAALMEGIDRARSRTGTPAPGHAVRPTGRRRVHLGLEFLVRELEYMALVTGGAGFGTPTTKPEKGRIIQILNRMKKHLSESPELKWLTAFLPILGKHPVSVYQRAIKSGRMDYALDVAIMLSKCEFAGLELPIAPSVLPSAVWQLRGRVMDDVLNLICERLAKSDGTADRVSPEQTIADVHLLLGGGKTGAVGK